MQEALLTHNVNSKFVANELSAADQVSCLIDYEVNPKLNEINEKHKLILKLNDLRKTHSDKWNEFQ